VLRKRQCHIHEWVEVKEVYAAFQNNNTSTSLDLSALLIGQCSFLLCRRASVAEHLIHKPKGSKSGASPHSILKRQKPFLGMAPPWSPISLFFFQGSLKCVHVRLTGSSLHVEPLQPRALQPRLSKSAIWQAAAMEHIKDESSRELAGVPFRDRVFTEDDWDAHTSFHRYLPEFFILCGPLKPFPVLFFSNSVGAIGVLMFHKRQFLGTGRVAPLYGFRGNASEACQQMQCFRWKCEESCFKQPSSTLFLLTYILNIARNP
jgi:hypothetical protein